MSKFHSLAVSRVTQETNDVIAVTFAVPDNLKQVFRFIQGQYLTLRATIDGTEVRRPYSICSAVQEDVLRIAIKKRPGGDFSVWANDTLKPGQVLDVMPPTGNFNAPLASENCKHYLGFAAGSGITPLLSIIKTTLIAEPNSTFTLCYGNRASSTAIFKDELAELKDIYLERIKLVYVMSREQQDIDLFNGRITKEKCDELLKYWINPGHIDTAFVCGPEDMMRGVLASLQSHGIPRQNIKLEFFTAGTPKQRSAVREQSAIAPQRSEITMVMDGNHIVFTMDKDRESILDAALKQGIDMRYSCKSGVCATCRCKITEGKVDMDANHALEDYEVARGFALSCQSFPASDRVIINFDQDI
jgi:ring-1,2-phenylacetyl-CoA epoxidase subunit PaaE